MRAVGYWILNAFVLLVIAGLVWLRHTDSLRRVPAPTPPATPAAGEAGRAPLPDARVGEKITYDIKLGPTTLGRCVFQNLRQTEYNGRPVNQIVFETQMARFRDRETIFSDAERFLPLKVEREIRAWPNYEFITEEYDQQAYTLTITKRKGKRVDRSQITKQSPLHNAILLPYHVRIIDGIAPGWSMPVNLPTQEFIIRLIGRQEVRVPAGRFPAYYFESDPKRFQIWVSADARRIPVKITGSGAIGYTLLMRDYQRQASGEGAPAGTE